jgi:hypothetical protein
MEINYMFSKINLDNNLKKIKENPTDKYFLARSIVVFTYATLEKFIKNLTEISLKMIISTEYFNNNYVRELMQVLENKKNEKIIFDLIMNYENIFVYKKDFKISKDSGYFSREGKINSVAISYIIKVLNLNRNPPFIKIPKLVIDNLCQVRMSLAHGDYFQELSNFGPSRSNLDINEVNKYISEEFKLNDNTRTEIIYFINEFKTKIVALLNEIETYINT